MTSHKNRSYRQSIVHPGKIIRAILEKAGLNSMMQSQNKLHSSKEKFTYSIKSTTPKWLAELPSEGGFPLLSKPARYGHDETKYDEQYKTGLADMSIGHGLANLLQEAGSDFTAPALEIGCGTGVLSVGLVDSAVYPEVIITDPSPVFLGITYNKMKRSEVNTDHAHFAVVKAEEIERLPKNEFSLVALRSTLHHVSDVDKFIHDAAMSLKPGGALVFQEPCTEGYILMGAIAQFIPLVLKQSDRELSSQHAVQIESFINAMQFYSRKDVDKSSAEDKHLFRVDELMKVGATAGLSVDFYPNMTFEHFAKPTEQRGDDHSFYAFFHDYLKYCMSFDQHLMDLIEKYFRSYCLRIEKLTPSNNPYMHGVFVCRKQ